MLHDLIVKKHAMPCVVGEKTSVNLSHHSQSTIVKRKVSREDEWGRQSEGFEGAILGEKGDEGYKAKGSEWKR